MESCGTRATLNAVGTRRKRDRWALIDGNNSTSGDDRIDKREVTTGSINGREVTTGSIDNGCDTIPLGGAADRSWFEKQDERHQVANENSGQQHVAELSSGGFHNRRLVVANENGDGSAGQQNAEQSDSDGHNCEQAIPLHVL